MPVSACSLLSLVKSYPWRCLEVSHCRTDQVVGILALPPSLSRKRQSQLIGWQGLHRRSFPHQFRTSQGKDPVAATTAEPPPLLQIAPHALETQPVFFPFRSIHPPRVDSVRIGLQRSLVGERPTRQVPIEHLWPCIQPSPHVSGRGVGLSEERLHAKGKQTQR